MAAVFKLKWGGVRAWGRGMVTYAPENLMKAVTPLHMHTLQFAVSRSAETSPCLQVKNSHRMGQASLPQALFSHGLLESFI